MTGPLATNDLVALAAVPGHTPVPFTVLSLTRLG